MAGLLDIAPASITVEVWGKPLECYGISVGGVTSLMSRFPEVAALFQGGVIDSKRLMACGGEIVAAIIAAGVGLAGNKDAEGKAALMPIEAQLDLLDAILQLTLPKGVGPFAERLAGLTNRLGAAANPAVPAPKSQKPSKP
jgi:hypothetical protein